jgi:3-methyladenine DNA glycosylase AlkD
VIAELQRALDAHADARTRDWWTRYLKNAIEYRGLGIPKIRELVAEWRAKNALDAAPPGEQFEIAIALLREPIAEDKLAGILYLQQYLVTEVAWREAVPRYAELFDEGFIHEWSTCDWFCVRVLGPTIAHNGLACAKAIASWHAAENLWRARASAVAFVYLVKDARWHDLIERSCATLIRREERFAKTAAGWVMRELSHHDPARVKRFVRKHEKNFSRESFKAATKFLK